MIAGFITLCRQHRSYSCWELLVRFYSISTFTQNVINLCQHIIEFLHHAICMMLCKCCIQHKYVTMPDTVMLKHLIQLFGNQYLGKLKKDWSQNTSLHILRALFQNAISATQKIKFAMPMPSLEIMISNITLPRYIYIYIYMRFTSYICAHIHICKRLFSKTQSMNLALVLQADYFEWRLSSFGKELFIMTYLL